MILVYVTTPDKNIARKIADTILNEKLAACANIIPLSSCYVWKGKTKSEDETVLILKTGNELWPDIQTAIKKIHPYEIPCIIKIPVEANEEFETWVRNNTRTT